MTEPLYSDQTNYILGARPFFILSFLASARMMSPQCSVLLCLSTLHLSFGDPPVHEDIIIPKNVPLLGGWFQQSPESLEVQAAARSAVESFNARSRARKLFRLLSIISAETKVTNMINFKIQAVVGKTTCLKTDQPEDLETCELGTRRLKCKFHVQFNPRNDKHELVNFLCYRINPSS